MEIKLNDKIYLDVIEAYVKNNPNETISLNKETLLRLIDIAKSGKIRIYDPDEKQLEQIPW